MMLGQVARAREHFVRTLDPQPLPPARVVSECITGEFDDQDALATFLLETSAVTIEHVEVPSSALLFCSRTADISPSILTCECAADRVKTKEFCKMLHIPCATAMPAATEEDVINALATIGLPLNLVPRMHTKEELQPEVLAKREHVMAAWEARGPGEWLLEQFTNPERELVCFAARSRGGQVVSYPVVEILRHKGIIQQIIAPAEHVSPAVAEYIAQTMSNAIDTLDHIGVLHLTFFVRGDTCLLDSLIPTVFCAGLWSVEGTKTNQYENLVRCLDSAELGPGELVTPCRTVRIFGSIPAAVKSLELSGVALHSYGIDTREDAQEEHVCVGHVTITGTDRLDFEDRWKKLCKALEIRG